MWGLNCKYYTKTFNTLDELIEDIMSSVIDPNYEIFRNGKITSEMAIDFIVF
jgi:hypothetical protein